MPRTAKYWIVLAIGGGLGTAAWAGAFEGTARWAFAEDPAPAPTLKPDVPRVADGRIHFSEAFAKRAKLSFEVAKPRSLAPMTEVTGQIGFSPDQVSAVGTRISGHVDDVLVVPGERVEAGQPLARLESSALGQAQARAQSARARERFTLADHQRKQQLVAEGIAAHRSAEMAQREHDAAKAERSAAEQAVRAMGGRAGSSLGRFVLRAPMEGEVIDVDLFRGQAVPPDHQAFRIADLSVVWLELAVFEQDLPRVHLGDTVHVRPAGDEGTLVDGVVAHVGSIIDPGTRSAIVRVQVDNARRTLRVGQSVRARIVGDGARTTALAVPRSAVVLIDGQPMVFVSDRDGVAEVRAIELGIRTPDAVQVVSGLTEGERVVVDGVFALKSELFR